MKWLSKTCSPHLYIVSALGNNLGNAFINAAHFRNMEILKLFVDIYGPAIIHTRRSDGNTALHVSCYEDKKEVMEFLLTSGAKVNAVNNHGQTPIYYAIIYGRLECFSVLLAAGVNVNQRENDGGTPLDWALRMAGGSTGGSTEGAKMVELLTAAGGLTAVQLTTTQLQDAHL